MAHRQYKVTENSNPLCPPQSPSHRGKRQQQELITELRRRQGKDSRHVYEGKDGAIEDIITGKYGITCKHGMVTGNKVIMTVSRFLHRVLPAVFHSPAALKTVPFTARSAKRSSRFFCDPAHPDEHYWDNKTETLYQRDRVHTSACKDDDVFVTWQCLLVINGTN